jgi:hypothetical protein
VSISDAPVVIARDQPIVRTPQLREVATGQCSYLVGVLARRNTAEVTNNLDNEPNILWTATDDYAKGAGFKI